jgi:fructosamine-3-kinase
MDRVALTLGAEVVAAVPVGGGDTSRAFRVELADGRVVFAKTHADPPPRCYSTEAASLEWLAQAAAVPVPRPLAHADDAPAFLVAPWIEIGRPDTGSDLELGRSLARLHRAGAPSFGRDDRRTTGSLALPNDPCPTWPEFYATQRLEPLSRIATERRALPTGSLRRLGTVIDRLDRLAGPPEAPARLHGDLWAGNRLVDREGRSWLIDPAARGGHREADLAMMQLFGGFGPGSFQAYEEVWPLADGWTERIELHQLAPLVVHAIKFGGYYVGAVGGVLDRLV